MLNIQVYLVTGGLSDSIYFSSTEILTQGGEKWESVGELPRSMSGVGAVSIDNTILVTGNYSLSIIRNR